MSAPAPSFFPVVIVGAGPTGLTLANLLGRYGVPTLVVERNATTVQEPRAVSIDDEALRTMQAAGLVGDVLEGVVPGYGSRYLGADGRPFLNVLPTESTYGYPRRNAFRQPRFEAVLRTGLGRFDHIETLFGWRLERFSQNESQVRLVLSGPADEERIVSCAFLIGCDGASSTVRTALGIPLDGDTFPEQWLIVDLEHSPAPSRDTIVFCDIKRPCIALPGPDETRRFEFKLLPGETSDSILKQDVVARLLAEHGADPRSVITRKTVYTFHARLAPTWREGRVFLAGDACHLSPPFAGQGMNSGVRDAHNLAWKLAAVTLGRLGAGVLDTYEIERRDHVRQMIQLALRLGRIMAPPSWIEGALTQLAFRCLRVWPAALQYFEQMKYKPPPYFRDGFQVLDNLGAGVSPVGRLLPQPHVANAAGARVLLDDIFGDHFVLLGAGDDCARFAAMTGQDVWRDLSVRRVFVGARAGVVGDVTIVEDKDARLSLCLEPGAVLLVRPDRYVAAAFALDQAEAASRKVAALIAGRRMLSPTEAAFSSAA